MASYTCITCRVMFAAKDDESSTEAADLQKAHYKTDWHRYNLKRKVASLPPVTAENFQERVIAQQKELAEKETDTSCSCRLCGKHFNTKNAYENHLKSKKHRELAAHEDADVQVMNAKNKEISARISTGKASKEAANVELEKMQVNVTANVELQSTSGTGEAQGLSAHLRDEMESEAEEWDDDALSPEECLFCRHVSKSLQKNIKHMTVEHSFYIPDIEFLVNLEGFIAYLGEKVGSMHMCLWCGDKSRVFTELKSVQQHMIDKGHCKLFHEGDAVLEYADFYDYRSSYPDFKGDEGTEEPMEQTNADDDDDDNDDASGNELDASGYQMTLPSGATVGHRSLMRYFRQKLRPDRQIILAKNSCEVSKVISQYKALGWTGTTGVAAMVKAKDIAYFNRHQTRQWTNLGVKGNQLQRHFRDQVFGF